MAILTTLSALLAATIASVSSAPLTPGLERFYIGTYSAGGSKGIYQSSLNLGTGAFTPTNLAGATVDPSFMAMSPDRRFLYAVNENPATVSAFAVNTTNGSLTFLNSQPANGGATCHIVVDATGKNVIVANYTGGNISMYPVQANGSLGTTNAFYQYAGGSHAHCVAIDSSNHFVFVCDLGLNQIHSYVLDAAAGKLTTNSTPNTSVTAGYGPRHITFDPQYKRAYVICETASKIIGFNFNATNGTLSAFQTVSTLPTNYSGGNTTAEIVVHPSGKFLYGSNRGLNSVAVFAINPADGTLTNIQQQAVAATPRNFAIDPTGQYCIVAAQDGNSVALYAIDAQTGMLTPAGQTLLLSQPVCILPFIIQPPQPSAGLQLGTNSLELQVGNTLSALTYQIYETPALSNNIAWNLWATGGTGQTNFSLPIELAQDFFQIRVLTNY